MGSEMGKGIKDVVIYTDGAAEPNPGPGGYGVVLMCGEHRRELSEGFKRTTNNRMELMGVIAGLEALKFKCSGTVYSDSKYVVDAVTLGWVKRWEENNWYRNRKKETKNIDLWQRFLEVFDKHEIKLVWVKGHAGIEENERCDQLAVAAAMGDDLVDDAGYVEVDRDVMSKAKPARPVKRGLKITHKKEGEPCRHCQMPIEKRAPKKKRIKRNQTYYFQWHLYCPGCKRTYMVEEAKCFIEAERVGLGREDADACGDGSLF